MNCLEAVENFSAYYEDSLDYRSLKHFEEHMATCLECQREYDQFCLSIKVSQELPQIEPSPAFLTTLEQKLEGNERESLTIWDRISRLFNTPLINMPHSNIARRVFTGAALLLLVATTTTIVFRDNLFHQENQPDATVPVITSEKAESPLIRETGGLSQDIDINELFRLGMGSEFSSIGVSPLMQQNYTLKQVSYSSATTGGGL